MSKELEIKILNVNPEILEKKLQKLGCEKTLDTVQKLYVYDVQTINGLYESIKADWNNESVGMIEVVIQRTKQLLLELNSIISSYDNQQLCEFFDKSSLLDVINAFEYTDEWFAKLTCFKVNKIISKYGVNPNKWIRLRQTGDKTTIAVKHILENCNFSNGLHQYGLSSIEETELDVNSIDVAKELLQTLGFYHRNYQEKKRISYIYKPLSVEIEIDTWPMIPPYMEVEGKGEKEIYDFIKLLGYLKEDTIIANTASVYEKYGINIFDYKELKFN